MVERKILSSFFSQLIEHFHRTMKKKKKKIQLNMNYSYPKPLTLTVFWWRL